LTIWIVRLRKSRAIGRSSSIARAPNEVTAARVATQLQKRGIARVRPLTGGIDAWEATQARRPGE